MEKLLSGSTTKSVRRIAFNFAVKMNISHRFDTEKSGWSLGKKILLRPPELSIRKPKATNGARVVRPNKINVDKFFKTALF